MPLQYGDNKNLDQIMPILDEYTLWYSRIVEYLFYPVEKQDQVPTETPNSFVDWVKDKDKHGATSPEAIEKLITLHTELVNLSKGLVHQVFELKSKPMHNDFVRFKTSQEEFLFHLRRIEREILVEGTGYDIMTGLRHVSMLVSDIEKEMHRLERHGKSFSIAMINVVDFKEMRTLFERARVESYIKHIAELIKLSVRSFDDAYYMGGGEFVLCLKQADSSGGIAALERLRSQLERNSVLYKLRSSSPEKKLSMTCCILEPTIGDSIERMISDLRADIAVSNTESVGSVLEYRELSPLQKFVQQQGN